MATTRRRPSAGGRRTRRRRKANPLMREVTSVIMITLGVLITIALFVENGGGFFGTFIKSALIGLFGFGALLLPFVLAAAGVFLLFAKRPFSGAKVLMAALLFVCVVTYAFLLTDNSKTPDTSSFFAYLMFYYNDGTLSNGGLVGGVFGNALVLILGKAGAYVALIATLIITCILISGKSLMNFIRNVSDAMVDFREGLEPAAEYEPDWEEEPEAGVTFVEPVIKQTRKAPVFTIDEHGPHSADNIDLVSESLENAGKKVVVVKECNQKKITDVVTLDPVAGVAHPVVSETDTMPKDIDGKGDAQPNDDADWNEPSDFPGEVYVQAPGQADLADFSIKEYRVEKSADKKQLPTPTFTTSDGQYSFPSLDLLNDNPASSNTGSRAQILENSRKLEETLKSFGVEAKVVEVSKGPTVTRYELSPGVGVKVSKISGLADDLALNLAAEGIRIEAPIPGKAAVGIEVPNKEVTPVYLSEVLSDDTFLDFPSKLAFGLGKDIAGNTVVADIAKMPHLLIAGATGSGKSVCINTLITGILYKAHPDEVKLLMVDPKVVELSIYNGIPHLLIPVVTDPKKAAGALNWAVQEMETRYNLFAKTAVRDLKGYNAYVKERGDGNLLPQIVIIIDELADLMMAAPNEVEDSICRLAQMARAAGLHLIIATQRPSVDVITGLIKANIPSRLAFAVSSGIDSRTILDMIGAEKLLGKGDMLFFPVGMGKPLRVQGAFISDKEVENIVNFVKQDQEAEYDQEMIDTITAAKALEQTDDQETDEFFVPAVDFLVQKEKASASLLQRQFRIGYNRASRLIEDLEARGIVGPEDGSKPRKVLITSAQWAERKARMNAE